MDSELKVSQVVQVSDCFEAVTVFRQWRNRLFVILILALGLLQVVFWLVTTGVIGREHQGLQSYTGLWGQVIKAGSHIGPRTIAGVIDIANAVSIVASLLYWLTIGSTLMISIVGRLGGMNHISRAFFISLVAFVFLVPWQQVLGPIVLGGLFGADEFLASAKLYPKGVYQQVLYYLRFSLYPIVLVVMLGRAQWRCARWTRLVLQRLEIL